MGMSDNRNIVIYGELNEGGLASITKELLNGGRKLADELDEELQVLFVGNEVRSRAEEAFAFGADKVYVIEGSAFVEYEGEVHTVALVQALEQLAPRFLLFGNTEVGADLGPRVAFRLHSAIATDCVTLDVEGETKGLLRTKPVNGGLAMAVFSSVGFPQIATMRPKSMNPAERTSAGEGKAVSLNIDLGAYSSRVRSLGKAIEETKGIKLEDAEIIVSGGRGMGGPEGFKEIERVAEILKGAVGGSRVAVDNGWIPTSLQIGLTGTIVAPRVYLAIAISGASQHMTGCSRSQRIIAINKDGSAPIFKQAHFGVVGDWKTVLPAFVEKLKELG
jgi:electron transfer flavoprotein alpha subunit